MNSDANNQQEQPAKLTRGQRGLINLQKYQRAKAHKQLNQHSFPGPHSRASALTRVDMRTAEGLIVKQFRDELIQYIGGSPTIVQRELIERCAWIKLRIVLMDQKTLAGHQMTWADSNYYLSWCNSLSRFMRQLGIKSNSTTPMPKPSIDDIMAEAKSK